MTDSWEISSPLPTNNAIVSGFSRQRSIFRIPINAPVKRRHSAFCEVGLGGDDAMVDARMQRESIPLLHVLEDQEDRVTKPETDLVTTPPKNKLQHMFNSALIPQTLFILVCAVALLWPSLSYISSTSRMAPIFATASEVDSIARMAKARGASLSPRQDASTVCKRWAHMSAVVNGTVYVYGGQAITQPSQKQDSWNNNFLTLDLTKTWQIGSPSLTTAAKPSQLPAVSLGTLWNDMNNLYLYGGEFSWQPPVSPSPMAVWQYSIKSKTWTQHATPKDVNGQAVERAAEGAGVSVPSLGRGFYLGGHLDGYTTQGWSQSIPRIYLQSTLEFTMPGFANTALKSSPAGTDGAYRNITAASAGFPQRADGVLVYVPGYSESGIIVALAGGTVDTFTQMNIIDVYDIATSKWYRQATTGPTPKIRVNPCAVAVSAADGSSTQIHMYGGQNLQPASNQTQYDDMWILTIPSFTWIEVEIDQSKQSAPPARAGHTCSIWDGQMVVIGGYVGQDLSCDSPGVYIFNTSSLVWQNQFNALGSTDPLNRQVAQKDDVNALQGSYGYLVPGLVQDKIGGNAQGAATATAPAQYATSGPLASGKPRTYTATGAGSTSTSQPGQGSGGSSGGGGGGGGSGGGSNAGAIAAGVIAGLLAILAAYLGFCAWIYRRQVKLYKNHLAMVQRESLSNDARILAAGGMFTTTSRGYSDKDRDSDIRQVSLDGRSGHSLQATTNTSGSGEGRGHVDSGRRHELGSNNPYRGVPGGTGYATANSSTDDLMRDHEPSFLGVMLNPRRSLRVVNKD